MRYNGVHINREEAARQQVEEGEYSAEAKVQVAVVLQTHRGPRWTHGRRQHYTQHTSHRQEHMSILYTTTVAKGHAAIPLIVRAHV